MSAKKECPFTHEELREMYEVQGMTAKSLAMQCNVTAGLLARWLKGNGIQIRHDIRRDSEENARPSKEWLWEKYWKEGLSLIEIGQAWSDAVGRSLPYGGPTVWKWMKKHGIHLRDSRDTLRAFLRSPRAREIRRENGMSMHAQGKLPKGNPEQMRKAQVLGVAKIRKEARRRIETRECCLFGCVVKITRPRHRFEGDTWFCCLSHKTTYYNRQRGQFRRDTALQAMKQEAEARAEQARHDALARLARGY